MRANGYEMLTLQTPTKSLLLGDCLPILKTVPDNSVDSLVSDPPSSISFMGKDWDSDRGGRTQWIAWLAEIMFEVRRVLKPGAHGLVWALPRTSHYTATALEDAGFEVRDCFVHLFGQGMPKGQNLKPAHECWWLVRKPLAEKTIGANVLKHGTGALNIDACRIHRDADDVPGWHKTGAKGSAGYQETDTFRIHDMTAEEVQERCGDKGRWPANLVLSHAPDCQLVGVRSIKGSGSVTGKEPTTKTHRVYGGFPGGRAPFNAYAGADGLEEIDDWECVPGCPVAEIDQQSGQSTSRRGVMNAGPYSEGWGSPNSGLHKRNPGVRGHNDSGGASRFFATFKYQAKPCRSERDAGLPDGEKNLHPCVKSVKLMSWLIRLITPPGGVVLDPFMGSGSTGVACQREGFSFIGIEQESSYYQIAKARIKAAQIDNTTDDR